jgi:hypothetical protein
MKDLEPLVRALVRMGFKRNQIEVYAKAVPIKGYKGTQMANVVIKASVNNSRSDIGFEFDKEAGCYISHIDEYDYRRAHYDKNWQQKLTQFYNLESTKILCDAQPGIEYTEGLDSNGNPTLVAKFTETHEENRMIEGL